MLREHWSEIFPGIGRVEKCSFKEYNAREQVSAQARRENFQAHQDLMRGVISLKKESKLQEMTKREQTLNNCEVGLNAFAEEFDFKRFIPRVIIAVKALMRIVLGCWAVPMQKNLGLLWNGTNGILFESGKTQVEVGRFVTNNFQHFGRALKTDLSRCDMHWSTPAYKSIEPIYRAWGVERLFLSAWRLFYSKQRGESRGGVYWTRESGMLPTGVALTTLSNTLINAVQILYAADCQGLKLNRDYTFILRGDDALIFSSKLDCERFRKDVARLGFKARRKLWFKRQCSVFVATAFYRHASVTCDFYYQHPL